jgi:hypothetical protein
MIVILPAELGLDGIEQDAAGDGWLLGFRDLSHNPTGWRSNDLTGCNP